MLKINKKATRHIVGTTVESEEPTMLYIPNEAKDKTVPKEELNSKYFLLTLQLIKITPIITPKIPAPATAKSENWLGS